MAIRPFLTTGIALASAGTIVAASPAGLTTPEAATASIPAPLAAKKTVNVDQLNLLAISDITWDAIVSNFNTGYGGWIEPDDPYYPYDEAEFPEGMYVDGFTGVAYYLSDQVLDSVILTGLPLVSDLAEFVYYYVNPYFYEVSALAAVHVALAQATDGPNGPFAQLLQAIFNPLGGTMMLAAPLLDEELPAPDTLADITFEKLIDIFNEGYGDYIGPEDDYYPQDPVLVDGFTGVSYYLGDAALQSIYEAEIPLVSEAAAFVRDELTSYFYEVSAVAAFHVALAKATDGPDGPFAQLLQSIFNPDAIEEEDDAAAQAEALTVTADVGPEVAPKQQKTVVEVSVSEAIEPQKPAADEEPAAEPAVDDGPEQAPEDPEPAAPVKRPKLNEKRESPLAGTLADLKEDTDKAAKSFGESVQKLRDAFTPKATPTAPEAEPAPDGGEEDGGESDAA